MTFVYFWPLSGLSQNDTMKGGGAMARKAREGAERGQQLWGISWPLFALQIYY